MSRLPTRAGSRALMVASESRRRRSMSGGSRTPSGYSGTFKTKTGTCRTYVPTPAGSRRSGSGRSRSASGRSARSGSMRTRTGPTGTWDPMSGRSGRSRSRSMSRSGRSRSRSGRSRSGSRSGYGGEQVIYEEEQSSCISPCCVIFWLLAMIATVLLTWLICMKVMDPKVTTDDDNRGSAQVGDYEAKITIIKIEIDTLKEKIIKAKLELKIKKEKAEAEGKLQKPIIEWIDPEPSCIDPYLPWISGALGLGLGWLGMWYFQSGKCEEGCTAALGGDQWASDVCTKVLPKVKGKFATFGGSDGVANKAAILSGTKTQGNNIVVGAPHGMDKHKTWVLKGAGSKGWGYLGF